MPPQPPAMSLNHPPQSHPATALAISDPCFGWDQTGLEGFFFFFGNQIDTNIILLGSLLHFIPVKCFTSVPAPPRQILPNLYSICVRICLPQQVGAATSQPSLLPPAAHFAKVYRDVAYFFTVWFEGPFTVHISE